MIKDYFNLTKPRMVLGNDIVAAAAFIFGSGVAGRPVDWLQFGLMLGGLSLVIGSGCAFNNWYDRGIDAKMSRTSTRALPAGRVRAKDAISLGSLLLAIGLPLLYFTGTLALAAALAGWIFYVLVYTPLKHRTGLALFAGAVAGATPPLVGYAAATGTLDYLAWALFIFLFLWQIPHFLAIARYRHDEYAAADVPLLVQKPATEHQRRRARIIFYSSLGVLAAFCALLVVL